MSRFFSRAWVIIVLIISFSSIVAIIIHFLNLDTQEIPEAPPPEISAQIIDSSSTKPTADEALAALFAMPVSGGNLKIDDNHLASFWFEQSFDDGAHKYHTFFIKTQIVEDESHDAYGSHADAPVISAVVYRYEDDQWYVASKQKNIGVFGSWGKTPNIKKGKLLHLAKGNMALLLNISYSGQGYTNKGKAIYTYYENNWGQVGYLQTGGNNSGVCDDEHKEDELLSACWRFTGEIKLAEDNIDDDYPDLVVDRKGTMTGENGRIIPVKDSTYIFNGEVYVEFKEDDSL